MAWGTLICLGLAVISLGLTFTAHKLRRPLIWRFAVPEIVPAQGAPRFETVLNHQLAQGQAHAPAIMHTPDGFRVIWFEGTAEAQADVALHGAGFTRTAEGWAGGPDGPFVSPAELSAAMEPEQSVVTLGNAIAHAGVAGGVLATVASIGGWAMASVVDIRMAGARVVRARRLNLSPVLGRSHLVKSPMVHYADGSVGVPAYFEMGAAYSVLARLDRAGRVVDTRRITGQGRPVQPMVVPLDPKRGVAFLRDLSGSNQLLHSHTEDGGQSWSPARAMDVFNPGAPVAGLGLGRGRILLAVNDQTEAPQVLRLVLSTDEGASWRALRIFEGSGAQRYPMLSRLPGGEIVLCYSSGGKQGVVAHVFNQAWVEAA